MKYRFFLLLSLFLPMLSYAQQFTIKDCISQVPTYTINISEEKISYHLNNSAKELSMAGDTKYQYSGNFHKIGEFRGSYSMVFSAKNRILYNNHQPICSYIDNININIKFVPVIYIAKDIQTYACTYQRTVNHEYLHYTHFHNAAVIVSKNMQSLANKYFHNINITRGNINDNTNSYFTYMQQEIANTVKQYSAPYDQAMDTEENYKYESGLCGDYERSLVSKVLQQ